MKLLLQVLLLVVMLALYKCQMGEYEDADLFEMSDIGNEENVLVPNITVYGKMEDREHDSVIVLCKFDQMTAIRYGWWMQMRLSVESELNYTKEIEECTGVICVFMVTVSPPASFTCVHEIISDYLYSETYNYKRSVLDHHEEGVSLFYICFSSSIAVVLVIMTVAVIMTTIRSKAKDSINTTTTDTGNDYTDA